jgi:hypothetical protein
MALVRRKFMDYALYVFPAVSTPLFQGKELLRDSQEAMRETQSEKRRAFPE